MVDANSHVNPLTDMHNIGDALLAEKFIDPVMDNDIYTLTYSNVKSVLKDLKQIGANQLINNKKVGLTGKTAFNKMCLYYETQKQADGLIPATFEVIFGQAWQGAQQTQSVDENNEVRIFIKNISTHV